MLWIQAPPAGQTEQTRVAAVALVDEDRPDRARAGVEVLVRAPGRKVDAPVVQGKLDVARGVSQVPADDDPGRVARRCEALHLQHLAVGEIDPREEDEREVGGVLGNRALEVGRTDRGLPAARTDDDEIGRRVETARCEMAGQGMAVGWEERAIGQDAPMSASWPEERGQQQVDVDRQGVEDRDLGWARTHDPGHRLTHRIVVGEPRPVAGEEAVDAEVRPALELRIDNAADAPWLEAQRLAGEIDRRRSIGPDEPVGDDEPVAKRGERIGLVAGEGVGLSQVAGSAGRHARRLR